MRVGYNPHKDEKITEQAYLHQIVIPVYIPNLEGYFKESYRILEFCLQSLFKTIHEKTFITIINNGSCLEIQNYLDTLYKNKNIHEIIHTENIGKLNGIMKGIAGNNIPYVTISDADVLFCNDWQEETMKIYSNFKKAGVVGTTPQFKMYETNCGNVLIENIISNKVQFSKVKSPSDLEKFYESIGWDKNYNQDYLLYNLSIEESNCNALIGSGHFVATYKKDLFKSIPTFIGYKMGGYSEAFLDKIPLKSGLWRLCTDKNFTYHMGNVTESWMEDVLNEEKTTTDFNYNLYKQNSKLKTVSKFEYFIKNKLFNKIFQTRFLKKIFYKRFKLPKEMRNKY